MKEPKTQGVVVCSPLSSGMPGVLKYSCSQCKQTIYIAPSTQELMATQGLKPICFQCAPRGEKLDLTVTEAQIDEVCQFTGLSRDEVKKRVRLVRAQISRINGGQPNG